MIAFGTMLGCRSAGGYRAAADSAVAANIRTAQLQALERTEPIRVESPADTLRRRLLLDQHLPYRGAASLGIHDLPDNDYWRGSRHLQPPVIAAADMTAVPTNGDLRIGLLDALQIGAHGSREYQQAKNDLFRAALVLDLEDNAFRSTFSGLLSAAMRQDGSDEAAGDVRSATGTAQGGLSRTFLNGTKLAGHIAVDLVRLLTQEMSSSLGIFADATISIPLLRGAGTSIAGEPLKQAEQNLLYEVYDFELFKSSFAVQIAGEYLGVLQLDGQVANAEENCRGLSVSVQRARRLADAGRLPGFQLDQAVQDELRARARWLDAKQAHAARLDRFKILLGLPADARIALDPAELERLNGVANTPPDAAARPAGASGTGEADAAGLDSGQSVRVALKHRFDLRVADGRVLDAQRAIHVAVDALRAEVSLLGSAAAGARRTSAGSAASDDAAIDPQQGLYAAVLIVDLPFERTAERNAYRRSLLNLEAAVRDRQGIEDKIKLEVRDALRDLQTAREKLTIQTQAMALAASRVRSTDLFLQAGRARMDDVLNAREALLNAQNGLSSARAGLRLAELALHRDLGLLPVSADGLWPETVVDEESE